MSKQASRSQIARFDDPIATRLIGWRRSPTAAATIDLCGALRREGDVSRGEVAALARQIERLHGDHAEVIVALGALQLHVRDLEAARVSFARAVRAAPKDPQARRLLGKVLLLRGDAIGAEAVLLHARLLELGFVGAGDAAPTALEADEDPHRTEAWCQRARSLVELQRHEGLAAVAASLEQDPEPVSAPASEVRIRSVPPPPPAMPPLPPLPVLPVPRAHRPLSPLRTPHPVRATMRALAPMITRPAPPAHLILAEVPIDLDIEALSERAPKVAQGTERRPIALFAAALSVFLLLSMVALSVWVAVVR